MKTLDKHDIAQLDALISKASNIAIVTHVHPDGDALGSTFGLSHYLATRGKSSTVIVPDEVPETLLFVLENAPLGQPINASERAEDAETVLRSADLLICCDFNAFRRAEQLEGILASLTCPKALIDHHINPDREAFNVCISEEQISSASELLYWVLLEMPDIAGKPEKLPIDCARCLMTGMTTDSNNFANSTYPSTLQMASALLGIGVDRDKIVSDIYNHYRETRFRLLGHLLSNCLTITSDGVAYMVLNKETKERFDVHEGDTEAFVNMPLGIDNVIMSIFLKQQDDELFRVSIRSKKGTSANMLARTYFHGGGHENAAGGKLFIPADVADAEDAAKYIENVTEKFFHEN